MNEALKTAIVVILAFACFLLIIAVGSGNFAKWYWRILFRRTFGEWPTYDEHLYKLMQKDVVDGKLALLATRLHKTNEAKNQLLAQISSTAKSQGRYLTYREAKVKLAGHERRIRDALKKFKKARMFARACGFSIHNDYRDYLDLPTSRPTFQR